MKIQAGMVELERGISPWSGLSLKLAVNILLIFGKNFRVYAEDIQRPAISASCHAGKFTRPLICFDFLNLK